MLIKHKNKLDSLSNALLNEVHRPQTNIFNKVLLIKDKNISQPLSLYGIDIQAELKYVGQHVLHITR
jgi:hypothetical protein